MVNAVPRPVASFRINPAAFWISLFAGLLLQISLPVRIPLARLFDLPLILTIYYAATRRSLLFGLALGTGLGLVQDALSHGLIGMDGISACLIGYMAAWISIKFDLEQLGARYVLTAVLVGVYGLILFALRHALFESTPPLRVLELASAMVVNAGLALICYPILDRFRRPV